MLPDLSKCKKLLHELAEERLMAKLYHRDPMFSQISLHVMHEGASDQHRDREGVQRKIKFYQVSGQIEIRQGEVASLTAGKWQEKVDELAAQMSRQQHEHFFRFLDQITQETGQIVDGKNKPFKARLFESLRMFPMEFDRENKPVWPTFIMSPKAADDFRKNMDELERDREAILEFEVLIAQKRSEWHDRKAARKLVD